METILANMGKTRYATMQGRQYLVAPLTLLVSGVIPGSKGPIYYPPEEVSNDVGIWNYMPMVVYHPEKEGQFISARNSDVIDKSAIGVVLNDGVDEEGKRVAEGWFDIDAVKRVDESLAPNIRIWPRLQAERAIELSTGLFLETNQAKSGSSWQGRPYDSIARNLKPDHLAILPDEEGACSNKDGCGVMVNQSEPTLQEKGLFAKIASFFGLTPKETLTTVINKVASETSNENHVEEKSAQEDSSTIRSAQLLTFKETNPTEVLTMNKQQKISYLIANCDCWKKKNEEILNKMDEDTLEALVKNAKKIIVVNAIASGKLNLNAKKKKVKNEEPTEPAGVDIAALADFLGITADPASDPLGFVKELQDKITEIQSKLGGTSASPPPAEPAPETPAETLSRTSTRNNKPQLSKLEREAIANKIQEDNRTKVKIVRMMIANVKGEEQRKSKAKFLLGKSLNELKGLVSLLPTNNRQDFQPIQRKPIYAGSGGRVNNQVQDDDMLPVPGMN